MTLLGSHICMIFHWIKQQRGKEVATPLPITIPLPIAAPKEGNVVPPVPPAEQAKVVALATKAPRTKPVPGPVWNTPGKARATAPKETIVAQMVDVIPQRPRRTAARRIDSPETEEVQEGLQEGTPEEAQQEQAQEDGVEEESEEETQKQSPIVANCDNFSKYLRRVLRADHDDCEVRLAAELGMLMARAFCEEFVAGTFTLL
ncbi:unnamed protein product [Calypogeia fissa]